MEQIVKINRPTYPVIIRPTGKLNVDTDVRYINKGDCIDALNTRSVTDLGGTTNSREIILGNTFVYQPQGIALQNKIFRINISSAIAATYSVEFFDANGVTLTVASVVVTVGNINTTLTDFRDDPATGIVAQLTAAGQTAIVGAPVVTGIDEGYLEVEITTVPYWNYDIRNQLGAVALADIVVIQEPVDQNLIGEWWRIGKYDLQGEEISWWTTQRNLPLNINVGAVANNAGQIEITTASLHGRVSNEKVTVLGVTGVPADGQWIITVTSNVSFILIGSTFAGAWTGGGVVTMNPNGNGEVGHAVKNEQTGIWSYFRLIRSQVFNFVTKKQIDSYCEKDSNRKSYYWTDDYNVPRLLYDRTLVYQNDSLLNFIDPLNTYSYSTLGDESTLTLSFFNIDFTFTGQTQSGGNILSGNSRYTIRMLTETLSATDWYFLDNPIEAGEGDDNGLIGQVFGNGAGVNTTKINNFLVTGNILGIFKYIELAVVNYQGLSKSGFIVRRELITSNTMTLQHNGFELNTQDLDIGTINQISKVYATAKSIDSLDNRIILSNLTTSNQLNLSAWFAAWEFSLGFVEIDDSGEYLVTGISTPAGQYQKADNVYHFASHMLNERYRYFGIAKFKNGSKSSAFFIRDAIFNTDNTQAGCATALTNLDLTALNSFQAKSFYIDFHGFNVNDIVNGIRISDVVDEIFIMRCELTNKRVLAGGIIIPAVSGFVENGGTTVTWNNQEFGEFPLVGGWSGAGIPADYFYGDTSAATDFTTQRRYAAFYSWDLTSANAAITPQVGDTIINYGQPQLNRNILTQLTYDNFFTEANGYTNSAVNIPVSLNVAAGIIMGHGGAGTINGNAWNKLLQLVETAPPDLNEYNAPAGLVLFTDTTDFVKLTSFSDGGYGNNRDRAIYRAQYIRDLTATAQYGNPITNTCVWTGTKITVDQNTITPYTPGITQVFGGDCFTQKVWFKDRFPLTETPNLGSGFGQGFGYFEQHRANFDMRANAGNGTFPSTTPNISDLIWLQRTAGQTARPPDEIFYNEGYTIRNEVQSFAAFDPNADINNDFPVRFAYSEKQQPGSGVASMRVFLPLNFYDLDYKNGEVVHHRIGNGELYSWQPRKFDRLYFNSNAIFSSTNGVEIILGSGAVMSRRPLELSGYGSSNKWAICKGVSAQGGDTFYWTNTDKRAMLRFGYDGTTQQTLLHGMDSFIRNNISMVIGKDTPADDEGIHTVWNHQFQEWITTVRAWRSDIPQFDAVVGYDIGVPVVFGSPLGFEQLPSFYVSLINNNVFPPDDFPLLWRQVPLTDTNYYNLWTLVFSEIKNGFDGFLSFHPRIYSQYRNTFLSPRPVSNVAQMYEHNRGTWGVWYDNDITSQAVNGLWRGVINIDPEEAKSFYSTRVMSEITPFRMNFENNNVQTFLNAADFELIENKYMAGLISDSTVTLANPLGLNSLDTDRIYGSYLETELIFEHSVYQRLFSVIVRTAMRPRNKNT